MLNIPVPRPAATAPGSRPPARAAATLTLLVLAVLALLTGCGGVSESVASAVKDSSSAVATARIALRQDMDGKLTRSAAVTSLDDELKEIQTSRSTVLKLSPATEQDRATQRQALEVLDRCAAGFATARAALAADEGGTPSLSDGDKALADAQDALKQLEDKVGQK
ncbi:MAG: hypothetical protein ACLGH7_00970 [Actinomycetes bacterium]